MYAFLKSPEGGALPYNQIRILVDEDATKSMIVSAMENVFKQAHTNDLILFFFSGHGVANAFLPFDFNGATNVLYHPEMIRIFNKSRAKHKVCIADACYAGSLMTPKKGEKGVNSNSIDQYYESLIRSKGGAAIMLSSADNEKSIEYPMKRQGIFSYYLIKGLKGAADNNGDKIITIKELFLFALYRTFYKYLGDKYMNLIK